MPDWKEMAEKGALGLGFDDLIINDGQSNGLDVIKVPTVLGDHRGANQLADDVMNGANETANQVAGSFGSGGQNAAAAPPTSPGSHDASAQGAVSFPFTDEIALLSPHSPAAPCLGSDISPARGLGAVEDLDSSVINPDVYDGARDESSATGTLGDSTFDALGVLDNTAPDDIWAESTASEMSWSYADLNPTIGDGSAGSVGGQPDWLA